MHNKRRVWVAAPYRENAATAIAESLARDASLLAFYTTLYPRLIPRLAKHVPGFIGRTLERELSRRAFSGIPPSAVKTRGAFEEWIRMSSVRLLKKPAISSDLMYWVKVRFDAKVARALTTDTPPDAIVGIYGSCRDSFRRAKQLGLNTVLHFVNSRPRAQNEILANMCSLRPGHHEMISQSVESRVEEEIALADVILVPSDFIARQFPDKSNVTVLPYGVDLDSYHPDTVNRHKNNEIVEVLCIAQMSHRKGIRQLVEAVRLLGPDVRLQLIGPIVSPEVLHGLPANVFYAGAVPPNGVVEAMKRADIFVLATLEDAFALVVLEAMACGLPVITTYNNGSAEIISQMKDGILVRAGEVSELQQSIQRLANDLDLRHNLGTSGSAKVRKSMGWDVYGAQVCKVIEDLA